MKFSCLSMDLEDWFDLKYLEPKVKNSDISMADGANRFLELLEVYDIRATFFVLRSFWQNHPSIIKKILKSGHELAIHGVDHRLLYEVPDKGFRKTLSQFKNDLEDFSGALIQGYRASCFSMTREKLEILQDLGFQYDSSKISHAGNEFYHPMHLKDWLSPLPGIYLKNHFVEFEFPSVSLLGKKMSITGGGYFRMFPWGLTETLLKKHLLDHSFYPFYIHPFELSMERLSSEHVAWSWLDQFRFTVGRSKVEVRLHLLCSLLKKQGFAFRTFAEAASAIREEQTPVYA